MKGFEIDIVVKETQEHIARKLVNTVGWGGRTGTAAEQEVNTGANSLKAGQAKRDREVSSPGMGRDKSSLSYAYCMLGRMLSTG